MRVPTKQIYRRRIIEGDLALSSVGALGHPRQLMGVEMSGLGDLGRGVIPGDGVAALVVVSHVEPPCDAP
jgi:hypothetical protein